MRSRHERSVPARHDWNNGRVYAMSTRSEALAAYVAQRRAAGLTFEEIAAETGRNVRTIYDVMAGRERPSHGATAGDKDLILEAAVAYIIRNNVAPTASNWNYTQAWRTGEVTYYRYLEGFILIKDHGRAVQRWPRPDVVAKTFGSMHELRLRAQRKIVELADAGSPYVPVVLPEHHLRACGREAMMRAMRDDRDPDLPVPRALPRALLPGLPLPPSPAEYEKRQRRRKARAQENPP